MGATRRPPQATEPAPPESSTEEVAAAIAVLMLAPTPPSVGAVATLLLPTLPAVVLAVPSLAADVAEAAASVALTTHRQPFEAGTPMGSLEVRARFENVLLRGFYAIAATRRLAGAVTGPGEGGAGERLRKALTVERGHLAAHVRESARRIEALRRLDVVVDQYGPVLDWFHGVAGTPADPRPNHLLADGKSFDVRRGPPVFTGAWPGVLPGCT